MQVSLAHNHLLAVVHSELPAESCSVSILDVGCGDGRLIALLGRELRALRPGLELSLYGFDVSGPGVQADGYFAATRELLAREAPGVDWSLRLAQIGPRDRWPYPDDSFDWVVSNQVLEHVQDHALVLSELARVLKPGGRSAHLFPPRENILEAHVRIPFAHWIHDHDRLRAYLRATTALGLGNFRERRREDPTLDAARFVETQAEYVARFTNYLSKGELLRLARQFGLRGSFRYTEHFYWNKLRKLLRRPYARRLGRLGIPVLHWMLVAGLSRVSCVTAVLEKHPSCRRG